MALTISRIDRVKRTYTLTAKDEDGQPVTDLTSVDVALVAPGAHVTGDTGWTTLTVTGMEVDVIYAGPDATAQANDVAVPVAGGYVHFKEVDGSFVKATKAERITVS